ncbi:Eukaryotic translation initiation factor 2 subunit beta [Cardamine amara subsp. amara]|uniref:Eukaryotic translation initiation factor 2 subunit beta n=1 Tax=Cardamine amara subsp. amara TaxID=228776 RepID=A0ABD1BXD8_CARAN
MADESNEITEERFRMVLKIVRENIPEPAGDWLRRVIRLQTPQIVPEGEKKTAFVNFMDICNTMRRQPHHVSSFLRYGFGSRCSFDEQQRWVVLGRFKLENFEALLRRYVIEYVVCLICKSTDTILPKENRVFVLRCEKCGSRREAWQIPWK